MKSRRNFPPNLEADIKFASCPTVMLLLVVLRYVSSSKACVWLIIKSEFKEMDYTSPFRATVSTKQPRYLCYWCCGSVAKLYPILCNPMDYSTPGFPVLHYLPEFSQTHVHWTGDAIQSSHPLLPTSPPAFNLSQHHGLLQRVSSSHQVAKVLELQHQSISQFSCSVVSNSLQPHGIQHARLRCLSPTPGAYLNSCPSSQRCHPIISSSVIPFCLQSFPASGSLPMNQLFASGGQSIEVSASASVLPINIQDWFPLGWTCWIFLQYKGLSRDFCNTSIQNHQFVSAQLSL